MDIDDILLIIAVTTIAAMLLKFGGLDKNLNQETKEYLEVQIEKTELEKEYWQKKIEMLENKNDNI